MTEKFYAGMKFASALIFFMLLAFGGPLKPEMVSFAFSFCLALALILERLDW